MISNLHLCFYYSLRRISPPFIRFLYAVFGYKHFLTTINYFRRPYTTFDGYILLLTAIYHIRRLYITFDGYILFLALRYCDFARIQVFPTISFLCELNTRLECNISLLALIQFSFWKRYFSRNTSMLKMWIFQTLKKTDLDIFNWIKLCYSNCDVP